MLGQGELLRIEIAPGFDPHSVAKGLTIKCKNERDSSLERSQKSNLSFRRLKGGNKMKYVKLSKLA